MKVRYIVYSIWFVIIFTSAIIYGTLFTTVLIALSALSFIKNILTTRIHKSRKSGDPNYHRYVAWGNNTVWILTQIFIAVNIYTPITDIISQGLNINSIAKIIITVIIYVLATTEGSVSMMRINLGKIKIPKILVFLTRTGRRQVRKN